MTRESGHAARTAFRGIALQLISGVGTKEIMRHEILDSLPPYGEPAKAFSATGMGAQSEGFVVKFFPSSGNDWVGNFQPGLSSLFEVVDHPNGVSSIVISGGQAYLVNPESEKCEQEFGGQIETIIPLPDQSALIFGNGLWFEAIGPDGFLWKSRRISWDGMQNVRQQDLSLIGESYDPMSDGWSEFNLDLTTGEVTGGSYSGSDAPNQ